MEGKDDFIVELKANFESISFIEYSTEGAN